MTTFIRFATLGVLVIFLATLFSKLKRQIDDAQRENKKIVKSCYDTALRSLQQIKERAQNDIIDISAGAARFAKLTAEEKQVRLDSARGLVASCDEKIAEIEAMCNRL